MCRVLGNHSSFFAGLSKFFFLMGLALDFMACNDTSVVVIGQNANCKVTILEM